VYVKELAQPCARGPKKYGGITDQQDMLANFLMNCVPVSLLDCDAMNYDEFLHDRRSLMAQKIKKWFEAL
jgi:hypothetical protein